MFGVFCVWGEQQPHHDDYPPIGFLVADDDDYDYDYDCDDAAVVDRLTISGRGPVV